MMKIKILTAVLLAVTAYGQSETSIRDSRLRFIPQAEGRILIGQSTPFPVQWASALSTLIAGVDEKGHPFIVQPDGTRKRVTRARLARFLLRTDKLTDAQRLYALRALFGVVRVDVLGRKR